MSAYTLTGPHPDHVPRTGAEHVGYSMNGGRRYATALRCSCGARLGRVSNSAPSTSNGRRDATRAYRAHLVATVGSAERLTVYRYHDGRHEYVVAAGTKAIAAAAVGTTPHSFGRFSSVTSNADAVAAAMRAPGHAFRREITARLDGDPWLPVGQCPTCEDTRCVHCGGPEFDYHTACITCRTCDPGNSTP